MSNPRSSRFVTMIEELVLKGELAGAGCLLLSPEEVTELGLCLVDMLEIVARGRVW